MKKCDISLTNDVTDVIALPKLETPKSTYIIRVILQRYFPTSPSKEKLELVVELLENKHVLQFELFPYFVQKIHLYCHPILRFWYYACLTFASTDVKLVYKKFQPTITYQTQGLSVYY